MSQNVRVLAYRVRANVLGDLSYSCTFADCAARARASGAKNCTQGGAKLPNYPIKWENANVVLLNRPFKTSSPRQPAGPCVGRGSVWCSSHWRGGYWSACLGSSDDQESTFPKA